MLFLMIFNSLCILITGNKKKCNLSKQTVLYYPKDLCLILQVFQLCLLREIA